LFISIFPLVNLELFFDKVSGAGSFFWLLLVFWPAYFLWCRHLDYPADLEKHIRNGKVWPYLPMFWKGKKRKLIRFTSIVLSWAGNLFCACALYYLFPYEHWILLIIGMGLSIFAEIRIRAISTGEIIRLQRDRYLQIYTKLANLALTKGDEISDSELSAKAQWQQHNDLRLADKQGRLMLFLRGDAKL